jgi:hypothetical protein
MKNRNYTMSAPVPVKVVKQSDNLVAIGKNNMTVPEFTARMVDLGFAGSAIPATLDQLNVGGCWLLSLPVQQKQFLETPGDFQQFAASHRGFKK